MPPSLVAIGTPGIDEVGITSKTDGVSINMSTREYEAWLLGTSRKSGKGYYRTTTPAATQAKPGAMPWPPVMLKKASGFKASPESDFHQLYLWHNLELVKL